MIGAMSHRGPDETGLYIDDCVGLGHARLSIVDLAGGTQPIRNETGRFWIVYNGEVYNHPELRADLEAKGHRFYTTCDTEVIVHLYEEKGLAGLHDLNGQFAFALWDAEDRELLLVRDRLGVRPLHYGLWEDRLVFGSEIKAIFALNDIPRQIDAVAMDQIFTFWTTLSPRTAFRGVCELPPGHYLKASEGRVLVGRYWELPLVPRDEQSDQPCGQLAEQAGSLLSDAVKIRLRADVPVGCYLSGGLDSSGITALTTRHARGSVRTFGIRFEEEIFDEGDYQREMVGHLGVSHSEILASNEAIAEALPDVIWHCEKPLLRTAPVPLFLLSNLVNESGMKVVLTGEGADEIFGGYDIFRETKVRRFWARVPEAGRRGELIDHLHGYVFRDDRLNSSVRSFFGRGLGDTGDPMFSHRIRWDNTARLKTFFSEDLRGERGQYDPYEEVMGDLPDAFHDADWLGKAQYLETSIFLSQYLLASQGDRVAMAHSVEIRLPFLDHRVVDFMARVPARWKILGLREKHLLKKAFDGVLPPRITARTKHPYRAPIGPSLLKGGGRDLVEEMLSERAIRESGLFDPDKVTRLLNKCVKLGSPGEVDSMGLVGILTAQMVHHRFVKDYPKPGPCVRPTLVVDRRSVAVGRWAARPR